MTEASHDKLRSLFLAACELEPSEQKIFLELVCGEDSSLRSQLEALLKEDPGSTHPVKPLLPSVGKLMKWADETSEHVVSLHGDADTETQVSQSGSPDPAVFLVPGSHHYSKIGEIAHGGMGIILKVWDRDINRPLAMKMMLGKADQPTALDPRTTARFLEEAQVTGQLDHPGIVPVHQLGLDDEDRPFFTMRLVQGRTLEEIFDLASRGEDGWTQARVMRVLIKVCETLAYAHSKRVIHRDVKPGNIMVGGFGETYVMDWGLAKVIGRQDLYDLRIQKSGKAQSSVHTHRSDQAKEDLRSPLITMDGTVLGTPSYMPPEQAEGHVDELDARSDVYAVGAMLYELLTGQMPYVKPGARMSPRTVLGAVIHGPPIPIHKINASVPQEVAAICEKAMARDKASRYESCLDMVEDLQAYLDHRVVKAYKTGALAEFKAWVSRNKSTAVAAAMALLLLVVVAVVASVGYVQTKDALHREAVQREGTTRNLYHSLVREARAIRLARDAGYRSRVWTRLGQALELETPEKNVAELRREAMACIGDFVGLEPTVWDFPDRVRSTALHPRANLFAIGFYNGTVSLRHLDTGEETARLEGHESAVSALTFGPGGKVLVSGDEDRTIRVWEPEGAHRWEPTRTATSEHRILSLAIAADGNRLALLPRNSAEVAIWSIKTGNWGANLRVRGIVRCIAWSPDRNVLAAGFFKDGSSNIAIWKSDTGQELPQIVPSDFGFLHALTFSGDGRFLACASEQGVAILETTGFQRWSFIRGDLAISVAFSPNNQLLAFSSTQMRVVRLWSVAANREVAALSDPGPRRRAHTLVFSSDGKALISPTYAAIRMWNVAGTDEKLVFAGHRGGVPGVAFSSDGLLLASASKDHTVKIWDATTAELLATTAGFSSAVQTLAFYPEGRILAAADWSGNVKIYGGPDWKELVDVEHKLGSQIWSVAFSPDGNHLAVSGAAAMGIWRVGLDPDAARPSLLELSRVMRQPARSVCFSPDSRTLAWIANDNSIRAWDLENDQALPSPSMRSVNSIHNLAFLPDSRHLVFVNTARAAEVWNVVTGEKSFSLGGKESGSTNGMELGDHIAVSPDGASLANSNPDRSVSIWDTQRRGLIGSLPGGTATVWCLAWSPDGKRLAVGFSDSSLVVWNLPRIRSQLAGLGLDW